MLSFKSAFFALICAILASVYFVIKAKFDDLQTQLFIAKQNLIKIHTQNAIFSANLQECHAKITEQNAAIKALEISPPNLSEIQRQNAAQFQKIYIKDKSCESELKFYKEITRKANEISRK